MDVLRSVMFGLLTVSLILGITTHRSAGDQSQISAENLSALNVLIKQTRTDANRTFWDNCLMSRSVSFCSKVYNLSSNRPNLPRCVCDRNQSQEEVLREQYKVCVEFAHLLDQFITIANSPSTAQLLSNLTFLRHNILESVNAKFHQLKLNLQKVTTTAKIDTDLTPDKIKSQEIVARMAIEMDTMSKVLASLQ